MISLPPAWIERCLEVLMNGKSDKKEKSFLRKPRTVQAIYFNSKLNFLVVSDTKHSIPVFLTSICAFEFKNSICGELINCFVQLDDFHFSTVLQNCSSRPVDILRNEGITFPFAIQCSKLTFLGNNDITLASDYSDINNSVLQICKGKNYGEVVNCLVQKQFPHAVWLPDEDGLFLIGCYDDANNLSLDDVNISADQMLILDELGEHYDHSIFVDFFSKNADCLIRDSHHSPVSLIDDDASLADSAGDEILECTQVADAIDHDDCIPSIPEILDQDTLVEDSRENCEEKLLLTSTCKKSIVDSSPILSRLFHDMKSNDFLRLFENLVPFDQYQGSRVPWDVLREAWETIELLFPTDLMSLTLTTDGIFEKSLDWMSKWLQVSVKKRDEMTLEYLLGKFIVLPLEDHHLYSQFTSSHQSCEADDILLDFSKLKTMICMDGLLFGKGLFYNNERMHVLLENNTVILMEIDDFLRYTLISNPLLSVKLMTKASSQDGTHRANSNRSKRTHKNLLCSHPVLTKKPRYNINSVVLDIFRNSVVLTGVTRYGDPITEKNLAIL